LIGRMKAWRLDFYLFFFRNMDMICINVHRCKDLSIWWMCVGRVSDRFDFNAYEIDFLFIIFLIFN
jgi:hypothetical protein